MGIRSRSKTEIPIGAIWLYYGATPPPTWLFCDGGSTTGYSALAAVVGATTPDMRGRAPIVVGTGSGLTARTLGTAYGAETATVAIANLPSHAHGSTSHTHGISTHSHTGGNHGHSANSHAHGASHAHNGHAHGGIVHVGSGDGNHDHQGTWEQTAGNPGGYFTGAYADTANAWSGNGGGNTGGGSVSAEAPETGGPNNINGTNPSSGTISSFNGSGTAVGIIPPAIGLQYIIKAHYDRSRSKHGIPTGAVWPYYGSSAPPGWLLCDGGSTTGYGRLAGQVGANVPDIRGRVPLGVGTGSGLTARALGTQYGAETATLALTNMPSHDHGGGSHGHTLSYHTHTGGSHSHSANGHVHNVDHDHLHAHGGNVMTGHGGWHGHGGDWGQVASSPQGFFTGAYADTYGSYQGYLSMSTGGPNTWNSEAPETGTAVHNVSAGGAASVTVMTSEGSGTGFSVLPPVTGLQYIIKT